MARLSTCKCCGKQLKSEEKHIHSSKTYCKKCYEKIIRESEEYKQLITFICENYLIDRPTGLILKQIKEYKNDYLYTYGGIVYTLWYVKEILNKEFIVTYGVSIVKYYYDEAKEYYSQQEKIKKDMETNCNAKIKTKIVKVGKGNKTTKTNSLIDLGNLIGGDNH